jgi:hypothetical protein
MDKINFKLKKDTIDEFKSVMTDLKKINPLVKLKIEDENLLIYSIDTLGQGKNAPGLAFKTYSFPLDHFFDIKLKYDKGGKDEFLEEEEIEDKLMLDWIIPDIGVFIKKLSFLSDSSDVKGSIKIRNINNVDYATLVIMSDGKFKFTITGGDQDAIKDISMNQLNQFLDTSNSDLNFSFPSKELLSARSASNIEGGDSNKNINIELKDNSVYFSQSNWEMLVGKKDFDSRKKITFNKKYLNNINPNVEEVYFYLFETFILYQEGNQKLMISFEQSF